MGTVKSLSVDVNEGHCFGLVIPLEVGVTT